MTHKKHLKLALTELGIKFEETETTIVIDYGKVKVEHSFEDGKFSGYKLIEEKKKNDGK